ncbi:MobV family relaxase, partial [Staphylococcus epidermidis]|uniref:MobV family relaxase n=1 Tax=Staphylococcus epidermidis TaxID=1282 RepID=UPI0028885EAC
RVQKNSVVMYSNIITLSKEEADRMGETRTKHYFKTCKDYFSGRFGEANVVSAKVHMDESAPHMHLHFIPVNHQGRLSARTAMNRQAINHIHDELTTHLCQQGFDVERGSTDDNKTYIQDIHEYKKKAKVLSELDQQIETKKQLLRDINDLHDEKEDLTRDIQNLKRKNYFLQEDSQQVQEDIDLYKHLRAISRDDFKKDEEKYQKAIETYEASLSGLRMNYRDLDKRNQHLTTQNNQMEHHLDMLNTRHQAMNDMVRNDTRILFAGLRCALKDMNIELSAEIKYQRMPEVGIDPDTVDQGALTHAYQGDVSGIDHHIRKASAPIKKETENDLELE